MKPITVRMPEDVADAIHRIAARKSAATGKTISKNRCYVQALKEYVLRHKSELPENNQNPPSES